MYLVVPNNFSKTPCILRKIEKWKLGEILRVRVPDDPSVMIGLRIFGVATFCFGGLRQRIRFGMNGRTENVLNSGTDKRRLKCLKQWDKDWESSSAYPEGRGSTKFS